MLTADLVRARVARGVVRPTYIDPGDAGLVRLATRLIQTFEAHRGKRRAALDEAVEDIDTPDVLLRRGLVKLLEDRSRFEVASPVPPREVRAVVFGLASRVHPVTTDVGPDVLELWSDGGLAAPELVPELVDTRAAEPAAEASAGAPGVGRPRWTHRDAVLRRAGAQLGLSPAQVLEALYGDLPEAEVLADFEALGGEALLHRYNLGLAQAVLLKATALTVTVPGKDPKRLRAFLRALKFHRLLMRIEGGGRGVWTLHLDGPLSLFKASNRYGLQMAQVLPALLHLEGWKLEAEVMWGQGREPRAFRLDPDAGLVSTTKQQGVYQTREESWFIERFAALDTPWTLVPDPPLLTLGGQEVVVPDVGLRHPDGRVAWVEILGFWRKASVEGRVAALRQCPELPLILAVSSQLRASTEELGEIPAEVVYFREIIPPREIVERAERVGRVEAG